MQHAAPWAISDRSHLENVIFICADSIRVCGILLQPFMPSKMETLLDMLAVAKQSRTFKYARLGADRSFGQPVPGQAKQQPNLFPALSIPS